MEVDVWVNSLKAACAAQKVFLAIDGDITADEVIQALAGSGDGEECAFLLSDYLGASEEFGVGVGSGNRYDRIIRTFDPVD